MSRPLHWPDEIGMPAQLPRESLVRQFDQDNLKPRDTGALHDRKAVGIPGDQHNAVHRSCRGISCNVEAQPHVDPLLFEAGTASMKSGSYLNSFCLASTLRWPPSMKTAALEVNKRPPKGLAREGSGEHARLRA